MVVLFSISIILYVYYCVHVFFISGIILTIVFLAVAISCAAGRQFVLKSTARRRQMHSLQVR